MNIFVSDSDPYLSAKALDDKRCIKMILESAQLMSGAINSMGGSSPYRSTHINHPCAVWARENQQNYWWLFQHYNALCQVYYDRFKKTHATLKHCVVYRDGVHLIPKGDLTMFKNCTIFKDVDNVYLAYQLALTDKWMKDKAKPKWTNDEPPEWFRDVQEIDDRQKDVMPSEH